MNRRRLVVSALIGLNVLLLLVLLAESNSLPRALAQRASAGGGEFLTVTAKAIGQTHDVLYLLDVSQDKLHAFFPKSVQSKQMEYAKFRDLKADFGAGETP